MFFAPSILWTATKKLIPTSRAYRTRRLCQNQCWLTSTVTSSSRPSSKLRKFWRSSTSVWRLKAIYSQYMHWHSTTLLRFISSWRTMTNAEILVSSCSANILAFITVSKCAWKGPINSWLWSMTCNRYFITCSLCWPTWPVLKTRTRPLPSWKLPKE